jgi:hypothetical protein
VWGSIESICKYIDELQGPVKPGNFLTRLISIKTLRKFFLHVVTVEIKNFSLVGRLKKNCRSCRPAMEGVLHTVALMCPRASLPLCLCLYECIHISRNICMAHINNTRNVQ